MLNNNLINLSLWESMSNDFFNSKPFNHIVIDNFLKTDVCLKILSEFPEYSDSKIWYKYDNALENKKTLNNWNLFGPSTYKFFYWANTNLVNYLEKLVGTKLFPDFGLHGGGLHIHGKGGKLNVHKDFSIHPKLGLHRKINFILYLNPEWNQEWGGHLQLCKDNQGEAGMPEVEINCIFNRAVIFDTTQNSWHGLPDSLNCPEFVYRKSLAVYYMVEPKFDTEQRTRAYFSPHENQKFDKKVLNFIKERSE